MPKRLKDNINRTRPINILLDGKKVQAYSGETIATVIVNEKGIGFRKTKKGAIRGPVCNMGVCYECTAKIIGEGNVRTCMTKVSEGMEVISESKINQLNENETKTQETNVIQDNEESDVYDVVIIGGGPAGMGAINELKKHKLKIAVVDEQSQLGGQIYRQSPKEFETIKKRNKLVERSKKIKNVEFIYETAVTGIMMDENKKVQDNKSEHSDLKEVLLEGKSSIFTKRLIIGSGAYDRLISVPGWTLPGVMSAGGIQLFIKSQGFLPGKNIFLTGTHPFIMIVAEQIIKSGGNVVGISFAQSFPELKKSIKYGIKSLKQTKKIKELISAYRTIRKAKVPIVFGKVPTMIKEQNKQKKIILKNTVSSKKLSDENEVVFESDVIGMCFGFKASSELIRQIGCDMDYNFDKGGWIAKHDYDMQSSIENIFVAGEITGIAGAEVSEIEGRLAGQGVIKSMDLSNMTSKINSLNKKRKPLVNFAEMLIEATSLPKSVYYSGVNKKCAETVVCKCEEATVKEIHETLDSYGSVESINAVKLATRCGMGLCQGRYCEEALAQVINYEDKDMNQKDSFTTRHPIKPISIRHLVE